MMNQFYAEQFASQAVASGIPREKVAALLKRAEEISYRRDSLKTAGAELVGRLMNKSGMQKSASSQAYVLGLLKTAFDEGANLPQAYDFCSRALVATNEKLAYMAKVAEVQNSPELSKYAEGFLASAKLAGMNEQDATNLLLNVIEREKRAHGGDDSAMFKHPQDPSSAGTPPGGGDPASGGGPAPGAPPMSSAPSPDGAPPGGDVGAAGGGDVAQEEQALMQMLQSLPPNEQQQILQQIISAIQQQQGQGGQPGAGPQGAPPSPGMPANGAGPAGPPPPPPSGPQ